MSTGFSETTKQYNKAYEPFVRAIVSGEKNIVFAPPALLMALVSLGEMTEGDTKKQILDVLGIDAEEANYMCRNVRSLLTDCLKTAQCNLAESVWINDALDMDREFVQKLCQNLNMDAFYVEMGSESVNKEIARWVNERTGNRLTGFTDLIELDAGVCLALFATLYLKVSWWNEFLKERTQPGAFLTTAGDRVACDFMDEEVRETVYTGEHYKAISLLLQDEFEMAFILPEQGVSVKELLGQRDAMDFLLTGDSRQAKEMQVHMRIPKFDLESHVDLIEMMGSLGIQDVLEPTKADFTPLSSNVRELFLSKGEQNTRLTIDEEGIEGASYVELVVYCGCAPNWEEVEKMDFFLDRPFLFVVRRNQVPVFVGMVENPAE